MASLYDPTYKRLIIRNFVDGNGVEQELRLPLVSDISGTSLSHSSSISRYRKTLTEYKNTVTKRVNRSSAMFIKGIIADDREVYPHVEGAQILPENCKTLDYYVNALTNLKPIVIYSMGSTTGTMVINEVKVDSYGRIRNFEIKGYRIC